MVAEPAAAVVTPPPVTPCSTPSAVCAVAIGHSHLLGSHWAQNFRILHGEQLTVHIHPIVLGDEDHPNVVEEGGRYVLSPRVAQRLQGELATLREPPPFIVAFIGGTEYFTIGHAEHPQRFDFVLPERPDLDVRSGVQIIPPSMIRITLERMMHHALKLMSALRAATSIPIIFVQSPPPIPSQEHILANPGPFREVIEQHGVMPATLRMKLWLLQSSIFRQRSEELGCRYLEPPAGGTDDAGFLYEPKWHHDSVHATLWYGELILQQIDLLYRQSLVTEVTS